MIETLAEIGLSKSRSGKKHTPHDTRHTFSWLCDVFKLDDTSKHLLMGHTLGNDVESTVYAHRTFTQLNAEICKIKRQLPSGADDLLQKKVRLRLTIDRRTLVALVV